MTTDLRKALLQWCEERLKQPTSDKEHVFLCLETTPFCKEYFGKPFLHRQHLMERLCTKAKVITPASKHAKGCHSGLDPESSTVLDSRFRGKDDFDIYCCRCNKPFGFHGIRHLTASILYKKGYPLAVIQAILRHANPNTTARYIRSLGLEETRGALEEGLKGPAQVIEFKKVDAV
jgi:integrase